MGGDLGSAVIRFLAWRLVRLFTVLLFASVLVFAAVYVAPGSPISALSGGRALTPDQIAALTQQYHLNDPIWTRYWQWLSGVLHGDFGVSLINQEGVSSLIAGRAGTTALLVLYASLLIVVIGISLGVVAALRGGAVDSAVISVTGAMAAIPSFVAAAVLVGLFAVNRQWFPVFGDGAGEGLGSRLWHLTLPAIALALAALGLCARVTRSSVIEEQDRPHVDIARSRGLPSSRILRHHILRNAMVPVTTAVGITIAGLIAGSVVVEQAFSLNGIGTLLIQAISDHDLAVVQAVTLILVAAFIILNTVVDLVHPLLDPRIQIEDLA
jgi:peptide/nickel transport system permease protein